MLELQHLPVRLARGQHQREHYHTLYVAAPGAAYGQDTGEHG